MTAVRKNVRAKQEGSLARGHTMRVERKKKGEEETRGDRGRLKGRYKSATLRVLPSGKRYQN